jgi:nitroreductase
LDQPVFPDELADIIEAGRWAPNAGPLHIAVIRNAELRKKINDRTRDAMIRSGNEFLQQRASLPGYEPLYGAPVLLLFSGPDDSPFSTHNAAVAAENVILEATGLGLGSCYLVSPTFALNGRNNRNLAEESSIPDDYIVQCAVVIGYAAAEDKFTAEERTMKGSVDYVD